MLRQQPSISYCDVVVVWGQMVCAPRFSLLPAGGWNWLSVRWTKHDNNNFPLRPIDPWMCGGVFPLARQKRNNTNAMKILNQVPGWGCVCCHCAGASSVTPQTRYFNFSTPHFFMIICWAKDHSSATDVWHVVIFCGQMITKKIGIAGATCGTGIVSNKFALVAHWHRGRFSDGVWRTTKRQHANVQTIYSMFHYLGDNSICLGHTIACSKCALHQQCAQTDAVILSVSKHRVFLYTFLDENQRWHSFDTERARSQVNIANEILMDNVFFWGWNFKHADGLIRAHCLHRPVYNS